MGDVPKKAHPTEQREHFINCINIPNRQTEKLNEQIEEIKKLKEAMERKDQEITELSEKLMPKDSRLASLEWMKMQKEEVRLSTDNLNESIMELYNRIMEKEKAKAQSTTISERKKVTDEIVKMEQLCENISKDILTNNEATVRKITNHFGTTLEADQTNEEGNSENMHTGEEWTSDEQKTLKELKELRKEIQRMGKVCENVSTDVKKKCEENIKEIKATLEVCMKSEQGSTLELKRMTEEIKQVGYLCEKVSADVKKRNAESDKEIKAALEACLDPTRESLSEIKKLTEQIPKIGKLCEKVSCDVKKKSEESLMEVKATLEDYMDPTRESLSDIKKNTDQIPKIGNVCENVSADVEKKCEEIIKETKATLVEVCSKQELRSSSELKKMTEEIERIGNICENVSTNLLIKSEENNNEIKATLEVYMDPTLESLSEIKKMTDQLPKMRNDCENVSRDVQKKYEESIKEIKATLEMCMKSEQASSLELKKMTEEIKQVGIACEKVSIDVEKKSSESDKAIKATLEAYLYPTRESLSEIKKMTDQIIKIGIACEKMPSDVKKKCEESCKEIKATLEDMKSEQVCSSSLNRMTEELRQLGNLLKNASTYLKKKNKEVNETSLEVCMELEQGDSSEEDKLTKDIQKIEDACEKTTDIELKSVMERKARWETRMDPKRETAELKIMTDRVRKNAIPCKNTPLDTASQLHQEANKEKCLEVNSQIQLFLGRWTHSSASKASTVITIGLEAKSGFYFCVHPNPNREQKYVQWLPDGVERNGMRATIEGNRLIITVLEKNYSTSYQLCDGGLKHNNDIYLRVASQ